MPEWCPQCNAMLPPGTAECPRCGAQLAGGGDGEAIRDKDVFWLSAYTIGIVLIPLVIGLLLGLICIGIFLTR
jgi:predicted amidophosphoribosyltransferase